MNPARELNIPSEKIPGGFRCPFTGREFLISYWGSTIEAHYQQRIHTLEHMHKEKQQFTAN